MMGVQMVSVGREKQQWLPFRAVLWCPGVGSHSARRAMGCKSSSGGAMVWKKT
jgi:hypothetical protein